MSHALKSKPQSGPKSARMSLASIPVLTKDAKAKLQSAARRSDRRTYPELPEWKTSSTK
ncbi:hypothetical protein [Paraburkholderia rhizosphaerae]|uniref:Uncharacterized protein n=1 Tax=Paraburkholderia rhizosphaerae TaxID=480658 RepID=A0A4R8LPE8_9BURK|nr:hypothetical protein [Paraburkholderia rhizosphaerae]TDY48188.1 hypothetical protein BX592_111123 [Paraburkholderia rhizosphaerae]